MEEISLSNFYMFQKIFKALAGGALALALLLPAPAFAQEDETVVDDAVLYQTQTDDDSVIYETQDYDWELLSDTDNLDNLSDEEAAVFSAALFLTGVGLVVFGVFALIAYVYTSWAFMVVAQKVGEQPAWLAWVPILNVYLLTKIAKVHPLSLLLMFVPIANIVYAVFLLMKIAERRGFPSWLGLFVLVPLAGLILPGYLAWAEPSKAK
jgi:hypothetical protein